MTREEEITQAHDAMTREAKSKIYYPDDPHIELERKLSFTLGAQWADAHPSDETIMRILNCIGYEEESWVEFVRKELEKRKEL